MTDIFQINASARTELGKAHMRRMRREGRIPGVVYGEGKEAVSLSASHNELMLSLEKEAFAASVLTLNLDGSEEKVVLKDLQRHPYKPQLLHVDLLRISETSTLHMTVALHFLNEDSAPGVKLSGCQVLHNMTEVDIACLPGNLPEFISVDVGGMEEGDTLHLSDLQLPEGVEIPSLALGPDHDLPVVSIYMPRAVEEDTEEDVAVEGDEEAGEDEES